MSLASIRENGNAGLCQGDGMGNFTQPTGTQFNHTVLVFRRKAEQRKRDADVIVQVAFR